MGRFSQGPSGAGGALRRTSVFPKENLDAGRFSSPVQMKGLGPRRALARWGKRTQAEDALLMKRLYQAACG